MVFLCCVAARTRVWENRMHKLFGITTFFRFGIHTFPLLLLLLLLLRLLRAQSKWVWRAQRTITHANSVKCRGWIMYMKWIQKSCAKNDQIKLHQKIFNVIINERHTYCLMIISVQISIFTAAHYWCSFAENQMPIRIFMLSFLFHLDAVVITKYFFLSSSAMCISCM